MTMEPPWMPEFRRRRERVFYAKTDLPLDAADMHELQAKKTGLLHEFRSLVQERSVLLFGKPADQVQARPDLGTFHSIFQISAGGSEWFLKADMLGVHGRAGDLLIDQQICQLLQSREFPVARVLGTDLDRVVLPFDFQITAAAPGVRVKELEHPQTQALPNGLLEELGRRMAEVHQWNVTGAGLFDPFYPLTGLHRTWSDYLLLRLAEHLEFCLHIGAIDQEEQALIERYFNQAGPLLKLVPVRLLHGDWGHHNIFANDGKVVAVIDWEDALGGDPVFDIAYWGTFVRPEMVDPFLQGYRERSPDLIRDQFEQRYWLYYLRVALSKTVHRRLFGVEDRPGRPPASRRIQLAIQRLGEVWER